MRNISLAVVALILLVTCTKEEADPRPYPRVTTQSVSDITAGGAVFHAEITFSATTITDHGFIWSTQNTLTLGNAEKISLGAKSGIGNFETSVESRLAEGAKYYVKAYARSDDYLVYGAAVEFVSLGSKAPVILEFTPARGRIFDTITVAGKFFSDIKSNNIVKFDTVEAYIIKSSETLLTVTVPGTLSKEKSKLSVSVFGNVGYSPNDFELIGPDIKSVSSLSIKACDTLLINGDNFAKNVKQVSVRVNGVVCKVLSVSATQIKIVVPIVLPTESEVLLKVTSSNIEQTFSQKLTYKKTSIDNVSSLDGITYGDTITFKGTLPRCEKVLIKMSGIEVQPVVQTESQVKIIVPLSLPGYEGNVQLWYGDNSFTYQRDFILGEPSISSITPSTGTFGDIITISGKNFYPKADGSEVYIGNGKGEIIS